MMRNKYKNAISHMAGLGKHVFRFFMLIGLILGAMEIACSAEPNGAKPSGGTIYPMQLNYGTLNALTDINRDDAQVAIEMNFDRLSNSLNPDFKVTIEFLPDALTAAGLIRQRKLHAISVTGIDFLVLRKLAGVTPLFVASKLPDTPLEPYVLLTRKGVSMEDLIAQDKRRLVVESNHPWDIGRIWLETVLHEKGLPPSKHLFTTIEAAKKPMRMVLPVFFGRADACLVPQSAYVTMADLNPQIGKKLHVLMRSPGFVKNLICIANFLDPKLVSEMEASLRDMHTTEDGRQLLLIFQLRRNFPYEPAYLLETERIFRKYRKLDPSPIK